MHPVSDSTRLPQRNSMRKVLGLLAVLMSLLLMAAGTALAAPPNPPPPPGPRHGHTNPGHVHLPPGKSRPPGTGSASGSATVRASSQAQSNGNSTVTVSAPTGTQSSDLLVAIQFGYEPNASSPFTLPSGWTGVGSVYTANSLAAIRVSRAPGSTTGPFTFGFSNAPGTGSPYSTVIVLAVTNADPDFPINVSPLFDQASNCTSNQAVAQALTPSIDNALLVTGAADVLGSPDNWTPATGMTERGDIAAGTTFVSTVDTQTLSGGANTSTGTRTMTGNSNPTGCWSSVSLAIAPPQTVSTSQNWSGYDVPVGSSPFTEVETTYTQPSVTCPVSDAWGVWWIGFDGWTDNTVEQSGTAAECTNGTPSYYAWSEMFPTENIIAFSSSAITVSPGDSITAKDTYNTSTHVYTLAVTNNTTGKTASRTTQCAANLTCSNSSVESIVERVGSGSGFFGLPNYGTVSMGTNKAATVANSTPAAFGSYSGTFPINMTRDGTSSGTPLAVVDPLDTTGMLFHDRWKAVS